MTLPLSVVASFDCFSDKTLVAIHPIKVGLCNHNYQVDYVGGRALLRVFGEGASSQQRAIEFATQQGAHALNIAPKPLCYYPIANTPLKFQQWCDSHAQINCGVMISEFFEGQCWSELSTINDDSLALLAQQMASLHQMTLPHNQNTNVDQSFTAPQDGLALLAHYWRCNSDHSAVNKRRYQRVVTKLSSLSLDYDCIIHRDLNATNILSNNDRQVIIDWEFCGEGDRYIDLATVVCELGLTTVQQEWLLLCYQRQCYQRQLSNDGQEPQPLSRDKLRLCRIYYLAVCWLWQPEPDRAQVWSDLRAHYCNQLDTLLANVD